MPRINNDLFRTLVLTILAGLAVLIVSVANRDVYSKELIDTRFKAVEREMSYIEEDVRWLVRRMGGTPSAEAGEDNHTPQSD